VASGAEAAGLLAGFTGARRKTRAEKGRERKTEGMSTEHAKTLVRTYYERVVSNGEVDRLEDYVSADYTEVYRGVRHAVGVEGAREHIVGVRKTYPDLRLRVDLQVAEGPWVVSLVTMTGTHRGEWQGMRPTHRRIETTAVNIDKVVAGRIVEHGGAANLLEPLLEIGAVKVVGAGGPESAT
jgi:predicted ester cyclase